MHLWYLVATTIKVDANGNATARMLPDLDMLNERSWHLREHDVKQQHGMVKT